MKTVELLLSEVTPHARRARNAGRSAFQPLSAGITLGGIEDKLCATQFHAPPALETVNKNFCEMAGIARSSSEQNA